MSIKMSNQYTGNSPILKVRVRRKIKLKTKELAAFRKLVDDYDIMDDAVEDIKLSRATIYNIYSKGYCNGESIKKVRAKLNPPVVLNEINHITSNN